MITLELDNGMTVAAETESFPAIAEQAGSLEVRICRKRDFAHFVNYPARISMQMKGDDVALRLQGCEIHYDLRDLLNDDLRAVLRYQAVRAA